MEDTFYNLKVLYNTQIRIETVNSLEPRETLVLVMEILLGRLGQILGGFRGAIVEYSLNSNFW